MHRYSTICTMMAQNQENAARTHLMDMAIPTEAFVHIDQTPWYICGAHISVILFTHSDGGSAIDVTVVMHCHDIVSYPWSSLRRHDRPCNSPKKIFYIFLLYNWYLFIQAEIVVEEVNHTVNWQLKTSFHPYYAAAIRVQKRLKRLLKLDWMWLPSPQRHLC